LVRHAKSSWDDFLVDDFDRSLTERGRSDARMMSALVGEKVPLPDFVVCSGARRVVQTLDIFRQENAAITGYEINQNIYNAEVDSLKCVIAETSNSVQTLMLVGHNPTISNLIREFTKAKMEDVPTACIAYIYLDIESWDEIFCARGKLEQLLFPRLFKD